jgi:hypothetical protein
MRREDYRAHNQDAEHGGDLSDGTVGTAGSRAKPLNDARQQFRRRSADGVKRLVNFCSQRVFLVHAYASGIA